MGIGYHRPLQKSQLLIVNAHANDRHRRLSEHGHKARLRHNPNRFLGGPETGTIGR